MRWEGEDGRGFSLLQPQARISPLLAAYGAPKPFEALNNPPTKTPRFPFAAEDSIRDAEFLISDRFVSSHIGAVCLDGAELSVSGEAMIFDDRYTVYRFDIEKGDHVLSLRLTSDVWTPDLLYLRGDFGIEVKTSGNPIYYGSVYSMQNYVPEYAQVTLSKRPSVLKTDMPWTKQKNPFYSGAVDYFFTVSIDDAFKPKYLVVPGVRDAVKVYIDDILVGDSIFPPYHIPVSLASGVHTIRIRVANTLGNMLEGYSAPSGLCEMPYLI